LVGSRARRIRSRGAAVDTQPMGARTGRSRLRQAFQPSRGVSAIGWSRRLGSRFNHLLPVGIGRPQAATARRWHLCAWPGYHRCLTTYTVQEGVTVGHSYPRAAIVAGASIRESGLPVSDREALSSHPGNGPVVVVYSWSVGDGGQRSCTQSASPVRRASCSGSIVRPQALQILPGRGQGDLQPAADHVRCSRVRE